MDRCLTFPVRNMQRGRVADLSPALASALGVQTDDVVEAIYPTR